MSAPTERETPAPTGPARVPGRQAHLPGRLRAQRRPQDVRRVVHAVRAARGRHRHVRREILRRGLPDRQAAVPGGVHRRGRAVRGRVPPGPARVREPVPIGDGRQGVRARRACRARCRPAPTQATCDGTKCDFACTTGYHKCGARCALDEDATACGQACTACPTDPNGAAQCVGGNCALACNTGYHLCGGRASATGTWGAAGPRRAPRARCRPAARSPATAPVRAGVPDGDQAVRGGVHSHRQPVRRPAPPGPTIAAASAPSNTSVDSCGTSCTSCPKPTGASTTTCTDDVRLHLRRGDPPLRHRRRRPLRGGQRRHRMRRDLHHLPDGSQRDGGVRERHVRADVQDGLPRLRRQVRGQQGGGDLRAERRASCMPCPVPTGGGTVTCDGLACVASCPTGMKLCLGACIPNANACMGMCMAGQHNCSGICQPDTSTTSCGVSCVSCPAPAANGVGDLHHRRPARIACSHRVQELPEHQPVHPDRRLLRQRGLHRRAGEHDGRVRDGEHLQLSRARAGFKMCGSACIPNASCCTNSDCMGAGTTCGGTCQTNGTCSYPTGTCGTASCSGANRIGTGTCSSGTCVLPAPMACASGFTCSGAGLCSNCAARFQGVRNHLHPHGELLQQRPTASARASRRAAEPAGPTAPARTRRRQ